MKQAITILYCIVLISSGVLTLTSHESAIKHRNKHLKTFGNGKTANKTSLPNLKPIPFNKKPADRMKNGVNSVGEKVSRDVTLTQFPFKVTRCDQIVYFPSAYINNADDYRERKHGYVAITAHYTNLYADKDAQKLIQQVVSSQATLFPTHIFGALGCLIVGGDRNQKPMRICTASKHNASNLIEVYKTFARCRLGDNLTPIPQEYLLKLIKMCNIDITKLYVGPEKVNVNEHGMSDPSLLKKKGVDKKKLRSQKMRSLKKKQPQFDFPSTADNKWEEDRVRYFMPNPLHVPGSRKFTKLPPGVKGGINPNNNPGNEPARASH